jgi:mono/diheme cytochrome c family protein
MKTMISPSRETSARRRGSRVLVFGLFAALAACGNPTSDSDQRGIRPLDPILVLQGKEIFRHATYGNEVYWTDTARMHEVIASAVSPALALAVGLQVDAEALPQAVKDAILAGQVDLNDPATTVTLLKLNAVLGVHGTVETVGGKDTLVAVGITCALCHSRVDNSFAPGIGVRQDGWAATSLNVGAIVALSPAIPDELKAILRSWGPGKYDPRINRDGLNTPIVIPPAYGLHGVAKETYTGDGPVSYWNAYVAVTQMHGRGNFRDPRLGIVVTADPDLVTEKLPALAEYQFSLTPPSAPGATDPSAVARGSAVFTGQGRCASCHLANQQFTDIDLGRLHLPSETGMNPSYAARTATKRYRTTPLRALWQHSPYFHDGSAATLEAVVTHYDHVLGLGLSTQQQADLAAYLRTL